MTDRLDELLTDTPEEAAYDEAGRQAIIWSNLFKAAVRPEVQALRDRVREAEAWNDALLIEVDKLKAELEAQHD